MLSRVAERLYWLARYIERTENTARLMLVRHHLILDLPKSIQPEWGYIIDVLGVREEFDATKRKPTEKNVIAFVFGDRTNPCSLINSISLARENMRTTREVLPSETWERINSLYLSIAQRANKDLQRSDRHKVLNNIIMSCQQIVGLLAGTMSHDDAYQFMRLGRHIERADMGSRIIDVTTASLKGEDEERQPYRNVMWISVLRSLSAYQMYRLNIRRKVKAEAVLEFLLKGRVFPRSTEFSLLALEECAKRLSNGDPALKIIQKVLDEIEQVELTDMRGEKLHLFIDELQFQLGEIHEIISKTWFYPDLKA